MPKKMTKESLNEALWEEYQEEMKNKDSPYTVGTFGVWCYHKGLTEGITPNYLRRTFLDELYEILNNLTDDLETDFVNGEEGYKTYQRSYEAIKKYTLSVLNKKIKDLEKTLGINNRHKSESIPLEHDKKCDSMRLQQDTVNINKANLEVEDE